MLLSNRSGARLTLGDKIGALEDANAAAAAAPPGFHTAYIRQVFSHIWLQQFEVRVRIQRSNGTTAHTSRRLLCFFV